MFPSSMFQLNLVEWLTALTLTASAVTAIFYTCRTMYRRLDRKMTKFLAPYNMVTDAVLGTSEKKGIVQNIEELNKRMGHVERELTPNGGSSTKDLAKQAATNVNLLLGIYRAGDDTDIDRAVFHADRASSVTWVNRTFLRWAGRSDVEMRGSGWLSSVHLDDRNGVRDELQTSIKDGREFEFRCRIISTDHVVRKVVIDIVPIYNDRREIEAWFGTLRLIP